MLTSTGHSDSKCRSHRVQFWHAHHLYIDSQLSALWFYLILNIVIICWSCRNAGLRAAYLAHWHDDDVRRYTFDVLSIPGSINAAFGHDLEGLFFLCFFSCAFCHEFGSLRHGNIDICLFARFFKCEIRTSACPVCGRWWGRQCRWLDSVRCSVAMRSFPQQIQTFLAFTATKDSCASWAIPCALVEIFGFWLRTWLNSASICFCIFLHAHRYTVIMQKQMCDYWICRETFKF